MKRNVYLLHIFYISEIVFFYQMYFVYIFGVILFFDQNLCLKTGRDDLKKDLKASENVDDAEYNYADDMRTGNEQINKNNSVPTTQKVLKLSNLLIQRDSTMMATSTKRPDSTLKPNVPRTTKWTNAQDTKSHSNDRAQKIIHQNFTDSARAAILQNTSILKSINDSRGIMIKLVNELKLLSSKVAETENILQSLQDMVCDCNNTNNSRNEITEDTPPEHLVMDPNGEPDENMMYPEGTIYITESSPIDKEIKKKKTPPNYEKWVNN